MDKRNVYNKASLVEPIVRHRVQDSLFYKQYLHLSNEQTILQVIVDQVHYIGGTDSNNRPSPFLCCLVRLLEIEPSPEIVDLYLSQNGYQEFKYLTALALIYNRMVMGSRFFVDFDRYITDYRKLRVQNKQFKMVNDLPVRYLIKHMDEWVDDLLENERVVDIKIPHLAPRLFYVERDEAQERVYGDGSEEMKEESEVANQDNISSEYESDSD